MSAMKALLMSELELIDDNFKYSSQDFYSFILGMYSMTRILAQRTNYSNESQVYILEELQAVRDMWIKTNRPK
jgi:hypothetical protein|tara:strand:- start:288 stop:506 length:219 start_codon:yes stop_codon:yes gene_type:complete